MYFPGHRRCFLSAVVSAGILAGALVLFKGDAQGEAQGEAIWRLDCFPRTAPKVAAPKVASRVSALDRHRSAA
jgi:hypothetical protein